MKDYDDERRLMREQDDSYAATLQADQKKVHVLVGLPF